jgi:RNA polymerase sigma factor (sigma-70 family)
MEMINESTLARLLAGDSSATNPAIIECLDLAKKIAKSFGRKYPHKRGDISSVALFGLCKAIHNIKDGKLRTDNARAYINNTIRGHIRHFIQQDHLIHISNYTLAKEMSSEDGFSFPVMYGIDARDKHDDEENEEDKLRTFDLPAPDTGDKEIVNEFYMQLTNFERIVLDLRSEGYTYTEIGDKVGKGKTWIEKTLIRIKDKFIRERSKHGR